MSNQRKYTQKQWFLSFAIAFVTIGLLFYAAMRLYAYETGKSLRGINLYKGSDI